MANYFCVTREAQKEVQNIALDTNFSIPGDPGFPLNQVCFLARNPSLPQMGQYLLMERRCLKRLPHAKMPKF
jgi:hypothetical protein